MPAKDLKRKGVLIATCLIVVSVAVELRAPLAGAKPSTPAARCQALTRLQWGGVEITSATMVPAAPAGTVPYGPFTKATIPVALPEHCRVEGVINRRKGAGGVEYGIGFALNLPSNWNGRFMFQG